MPRQFLVLLLALALAPATSWAQRVSPPLWQAEPVSTIATAGEPRPPNPVPQNPRFPSTVTPTYWKEGGLVGAILVGLAGAVLAGGLCGDSETNQGGCTGATAGGFVVGGLTGFGVGALIGGQFHKRRNE